MSIHRKLIVALLIAAATPLLVASCVFLGYGVYQQWHELQTHIDELAEGVALNASASLRAGDLGTLQRLLARFDSEPHVIRVCVYDLKDHLQGGYRRSEGEKSCAGRFRTAAGVPREIVATRAVVDERGRLGTVRVDSDYSRLFTHLLRFFPIVLLILVGALLVAVHLSEALYVAISKPLVRLTRIAEAVTIRKDYRIRAKKTSDDEIGVLMDAMNAMLTEIARREEAMAAVNRELVVSRNEVERAADALVASEKRFRAAFAGAPIGFALLDAAGHVLESNAALQEMIGYAHAELQHIRLTDVTHPDEQESASSRFGDLVADRMPFYQADQRYVTKSGRIMWAHATLTRLHDHNGHCLAVAMLQDVTAQKHLEEQFRHSQKMEAIGRLAGGVAHDFNNLLTVIKGNTELLVKRLPAQSPSLRNLMQVRKAADRAASLVDQLLAFSRKRFVAPAVLDLNAVVREVRTMLARLIGEDIEVVLDIGSTPMWVNNDPVQLEQILLNLAVNARDAMPDGGTMRVGTKSLYLCERAAAQHNVQPGRYVTLSVEDTGTGMTEEVRSRIFEPFFTTKEVGKGTGLGLSTVYGLVEQGGGYIEVNSAIGKGSRFTVAFPAVVVSERETDPPTASLNANGGEETILVVEDEELVRAVTCETLASQGYRILEARDAEVAIEILRSDEHTVDLMLTDVVMPKLSGPELAKKSVLMRPGLKIVFMSGYNEIGYPEAAMVLQKPFTPDELARVVRAELDGQPVPVPDTLTGVP